MNTPLGNRELRPEGCISGHVEGVVREWPAGAGRWKITANTNSLGHAL